MNLPSQAAESQIGLETFLSLVYLPPALRPAIRAKWKTLGMDSAKSNAGATCEVNILEPKNEILFSEIRSFVERFKQKMLPVMPSTQSIESLHCLCDRLASPEFLAQSLQAFEKKPENRVAFEAILRDQNKRVVPLSEDNAAAIRSAVLRVISSGA